MVVVSNDSEILVDEVAVTVFVEVAAVEVGEVDLMLGMVVVEDIDEDSP